MKKVIRTFVAMEYKRWNDPEMVALRAKYENKEMTAMHGSWTEGYYDKRAEYDAYMAERDRNHQGDDLQDAFLFAHMKQRPMAPVQETIDIPHEVVEDEPKLLGQ